MFKRQTQLCIFIDNRPGRFKELCDLLYNNGIDILAMNLHADNEVGILRMLVGDTLKAIRILTEDNVPYLQTEVLVAEVPNQPGMAAGVGDKLAQAGINIEYTYFSVSAIADTPALMVFKVSNLEQALSSLQESSKQYN